MEQPGAVNPYPQPGEVLDGKYRIERMLGEGGMGAVAKATHLVRRAPVALKFMSGAVLALPGAVERFVNEGVAASQIDSDHVVRVLDVGRMPNGSPYLVMEFLDGRDLGELIAAEGSVASERAVHFCLQMLRALHTAHRAGVVHRDMKPSNCFVIEKDGEPDFLKLVDFGISKVRSADDSRGPDLTRTNSALGTPLYMSPEQARSPRDVDHRSDLYSVGAILYELLCGHTPYTSESGEYTEILFKIFTTEPEPLRSRRPDISDGLATVVHRALARSRDDRFGSALEMADALIPYADGRSADLIARMRGARGRSAGAHDLRIPPGFDSSLTPRGPSESPARSPFPSASPAALRAPRVPTDVGLSLSVPGAGKATRLMVVVGLIATGIAMAIFAIIVGIVRLTERAPSPTSAPVHAQSSSAESNGAPTPAERGGSGTPSLPTSVELTPRPTTGELPYASAVGSGLAPSVGAPGTGAPTARPSLTPSPSTSALVRSGAPSAPATSASSREALQGQGGGSKPASHTPGGPTSDLPKELGDLKLH